MEIYRFTSPPLPVKNTFIALGTFDGLHLGHQQIIRRTVEEAAKLGVKAGVLTFNPHPRDVVGGTKPPRLITGYREKEELMAAMGLDYYFVQNFTPDFAELSAADFIKTYLLAGLQIKGLVIGEDFRFGAGGEGNWQSLQEAQGAEGFRTIVMETLKKCSIDISSTHIRQLIRAGDVDKVPAFLGRPFSITGIVKKGDGRGKILNYPTANLDFPSKIIRPKAGVYAAIASLAGSDYPAVANYGCRPTFNKENFQLEVHFLDYAGDLYDREVKVSFLKYLRREHNFKDSEELKQQISLDVCAVQKLLAGLFLYK